MTFGYQRCAYCGEEYQPYAIETYEAQIENFEVLCKECLEIMVDEKYEGGKSCEQEETEK